MELLYIVVIVALAVLYAFAKIELSHARQRYVISEERRAQWYNAYEEKAAKLNSLHVAIDLLRENGKSKRSRYYEEALQDVQLLIADDDLSDGGAQA